MKIMSAYIAALFKLSVKFQNAAIITRKDIEYIMFKRHSYIAVIHNIVHTHIIKKGEIYLKPKTLIVWVGET